MTRITLLTAIAMLMAHLSLFSQTAFQKIYGESGSTIGNAVLALPDSGYLVAGAAVGPVPGSHASPALYRLAPDGAVVWKKSYPTTVDGVIQHLVPAKDGGYLAVGFYRAGGVVERLLLLKTDADGNLQWSKRLSFQSLSNHVIAVPDGYLIAGLQYSNPIGVIDGFFVKIDNSGELTWMRSYGAPDKVVNINHFLLENDTLFTIGSYDQHPALFAISLESGLMHFARYYSKPNDIYGVTSRKLVPTADGNFIFSGQSAALVSSNYTPVNTIIKITRDGTPLNSAFLYSNDLLTFNNMQRSPDGRLVLCGQAYTGNNQFQSVILRSDDNFSTPEVLQYSNNVNLSTFYTCTPLPDGGVLALGDFIPLLNVQDTTVVSYLQVTRTQPDGLLDGCCIQPRDIYTTSYPVTASNLSLSVELEVGENLQNLNLSTQEETLAVAEYCPHATIEASRTLRFCPGDAIFLSGQIYTEPAIVVDTIYNSDGCDTIRTTTLEWLPLPLSSQTIAFCPGDAVIYNGVMYTQPTTVTDTLYSINGCDTIRTTTLEWSSLPTLIQTFEFCPDDYIVFNGVEYNQPAVVTDTLPGLSGCDTIRTTYLVYTDLSAPSILSLQCPADQTVVVPYGTGSVPVSYSFPGMVNDCPCGAGTLSLSEGFYSGDNFPTGTTLVCYQASDACGNNTSCCFSVSVEQSADAPACDTKTTSCIKFEILSISRNNAGQKTYRMRATNTCSSTLAYIAFQLPDGLKADNPSDASTYTSPEGNNYVVRNPNAAPFHSIRFKPASAGLANGASDVFEYTLPPQADPDFIYAYARLANGTGYETHLNVFGCPVLSVQQRSAAPLVGQTNGDMILYPNPTTGMVYIQLPPWNGQRVQVAVFDAPGRLLLERTAVCSGTDLALDIENVCGPGVYQVLVVSETGERRTGRLAVEK